MKSDFYTTFNTWHTQFVVSYFEKTNKQHPFLYDYILKKDVMYRNSQDKEKKPGFVYFLDDIDEKKLPSHTVFTDRMNTQKVEKHFSSFISLFEALLCPTVEHYTLRFQHSLDKAEKVKTDFIGNITYKNVNHTFQENTLEDFMATAHEIGIIPKLPNTA